MNITTKLTGMRAIKTKWIPCTNTKPARIMATNGDKKIYISAGLYDVTTAHEVAAKTLLEALEWEGDWTGAYFELCYYWTRG